MGMNKEELNEIESIDIVLNDIDDLDMGLEVISYKVRKSLQELSKVAMEQSSQLQAYKDKEDKLREYITSYESISTIQGLNNIDKNKDLDNTTMIEMTNRYLEVHDKLLQILNEGSDE